MVGRISGKMTEQEAPILVDHKSSRHLHGIALRDAGQMAFACRLQSFPQETGRKQLHEVGPLESVSAVEMFFRIGDYGERHTILLAERLRFRRCPHAGQNHLYARLIEGRLFLAQLRHLLSAERSAKVAEKNQGQRFRPPEFAQPFFCPVSQQNIMVRGNHCILIHGCPAL